MLRNLVAFLLLLGGCPGPVDPIGPSGDDDDDVTGDDDDDDDTLPPESDEGSVMVVQTLPWVDAQSGHTLFGGLFAADAGGVLNLVQCIGARDAFCAQEWPVDPGDSVLVDAWTSTVNSSLDTREVGPTVRLGPFAADYVYDSAADLGFYFETWDTTLNDPGPWGLELDGGDGWFDYQGSGDLVAPTPMVVTSHDPLQEIELFDADPVALRWEPGSSGEVHLLVSTSIEKRLYKLEDNGAFDLDLSGYSLADGAEVELVLGRWTSGELQIGDNDVLLQAQSNQPLRGVWRNIGAREDLTGSFFDTCAEAEAAAGVPEGYYSGDFTSFADHIDPGASGCTGFAAPGGEAFVPVDVQPDVELRATYSLADDDASLYLLTDCTDTGTCLQGADGTGQETVEWLNETGQARRVYLVLDAFDGVTTPFRLDLTLEAQGGDILVNTCAEAIAQGPVSSGNYGGLLSDHINLLEPSCALYPAGGEGMVEVFLAAGQTLTATATTPGATAGLYLMSNCSIADSCFQVGTGQLQYDNSTPFGQTFTLVLDSPLGIGEYFLDIEIQ